MTGRIAKTGIRIACSVLISAAIFNPVHAFDGGSDDDRDRRERGDRGCGLTLIGLSADRMLVNLKECDPRNARRLIGISGLTGSDTILVGIDFRVQDGKLYGVGDGGGIYVVDATSGIATKSRQLTVALSGTSFGVDFNPAANALRIVSNTGQNLRHPFADPAAATIIDGALNYTTGMTAAGIAGAAYVNNDLVPETATLLFDIDTALNQLALQAPPNSGGLIPVGALTVDPDSSVGFDIYSDAKNGVTQSNTGYATLSVGGVTGLYKINLLSGKASRIDTVRYAIIDLAISIDQ